MPGYLVEHAMALAEHPRAVEWLDFGLKAMLTVHPHWAGQDGGWAQGVQSGLRLVGLPACEPIGPAPLAAHDKGYC